MQMSFRSALSHCLVGVQTLEVYLVWMGIHTPSLLSSTGAAQFERHGLGALDIAHQGQECCPHSVVVL